MVLGENPDVIRLQRVEDDLTSIMNSDSELGREAGGVMRMLVLTHKGPR